ncbi:unnamed protein product [Prorocentrum cordatum]|uniref:Uncharacterized protein n=1 Tax=Prorocentrum cordatum TaxID=2364126 RepID=A0ABN9UX33_9DINO|nr:unnamed protein product [Polarella glacialis]
MLGMWETDDCRLASRTFLLVSLDPRVHDASQPRLAMLQETCQFPFARVAHQEISIADWRDVAGRFVIALAGCCDEEDEQDSDRCQREPRVDLAAWQGVGCGLARAIAACEPDE